MNYEASLLEIHGGAEEKYRKGVGINITEMKGDDHDKVVDPAMGIIGEMLRKAKVLRLVG